MKRVALGLTLIVVAAFLVIGSLSNTVQAARPNLDTGGRGQPEQAEQPGGATSTATATCVPFVRIASAQNPVIVDGGVKPARSESRQASDPLPAVVKSQSGSPAKLALPAAPNVVLLDQYNNDLGNGIVSANRTDNPTFSAEAADDFVVPAGQTWQINQMDVRARVGFPNPTSFNVYIYTESATLPGTPVYTATNLAVGGTNPDYVINLTTPVNIATGTYWVSVQGNIVGANWYWQGRSVLNNNSTAWREGGAYATGCTSWTRLTTCAGFSWPGQMFRLNGTIGGGSCPTSTIVPSSTSTSTATVTPIPTNTQTSVPTGTTAASATYVSTSTATSVSTSVATSTATVTACTITFSDVPPDHTFYSFIRCLACRGIISGYSDGTFKPGNEITRGQIAKMVSNAAGLENDPGGQLFEDVPPTHTFYAWINRLSQLGYMGGYPCGTIPEEPCEPPDNRPYFRPFANATRGQLAKIVSNTAGIGGTPSGLYFTDVPEEHPFYVWIMRLTNLGVMGGYLCGGEGEPCDDQNRPYFRPFANVTRGQASKIVANTFFPNCETLVGR
ncbi:MAG TPA: S-layer homology domain-containing protein [Chloroflexia bacterium]|nr:S-layer homology domain-containing protein [Chloroflexia bacterium]